MTAVVGVVISREDAERATRALRSIGIPDRDINLLAPGASGSEPGAVPTTDAEQPGIGKALGSVVGGAAGAAGGISLGVTAATVLPGVGPVLVVGSIAAALLGASGAIAGGVAGASLEEALTRGLPKDELYIYEDAVRKGRTVVIAFAKDDTQAEAARGVLTQLGAESVDAARQKWWLGLRAVEEEQYTGQGGDFKKDESLYRLGFDAALRLRAPDMTYEEVAADLREQYGDACAASAFRRGFERGQAYSQAPTQSRERK